MTLFEQVKECVTARQAAEHYGIKVKRNGMACCPFHKDRHPSMKADKIYHCFACGVGGDGWQETGFQLSHSGENSGTFQAVGGSGTAQAGSCH